MAKTSTPKTVVVAVDPSEEARHALDWASCWALAHGSQLVLCHAVTEETACSPPPREPPSGERTASGQMASASWLEDVAGSLRARGLDARVELVAGPVTDAVLRTARRSGADLIVAGAPRRSSWRSPLLGSCATRLIEEAPQPILAIPPRAAPARRIERVLIPVEFASDLPAAVRAVEGVVGPDAPSAHMTLLYVHQPSYAAASPWNGRLLLGPRRIATAAAVRHLEQEARRMRDRARRIETVACGGDPAHVIEREAQRLAADLVAVVHGPWSASGPFRHGTLEQILASSSCPVLAIARESRAAELATTRAAPSGPETASTPQPARS